MTEENMQFYIYGSEKRITAREINRKSIGYAVIGLLLMLSPLYFLIPLFFLPLSLVDTLFPYMVGAMISISFVGIVLFVMKAVGSQQLIRGLEILSRFSPEAIVKGNSAFAKRGSIYAAVHGEHILFIGFRSEERHEEGKVSVPGNFWRWEDRTEIDNFELFRREDESTVLDPEGYFVSGPGIVYGAPYHDRVSYFSAPDFDEIQIQAIVTKLEEDLSRTYRQ